MNTSKAISLMNEYQIDTSTANTHTKQERDGTNEMQVVFHTGAHCTDDERLLKCLMRNNSVMGDNGSFAPRPIAYRQILKESFQAMDDGEQPTQEARDVLIDEILEDTNADRLIMSNTHFFGSQRRAFGDGVLYPDAPRRVAQMRRLFHLDQIEVFMALCNPAAFIPGILAKAPPKRINAVLQEIDLQTLRWSDLILRMRDAAPDMVLTVWCNEDLPLIWGEVLREMAGLELTHKIKGEFDLLEQIMTTEGMQRFKSYIRQKPQMNEMQLRRVIAAFLDKFAKDDELEEVLDLPGWTEDLVDELTHLYDEDMFVIQRIPGVQLITP
jgi:hypothetical protein